MRILIKAVLCLLFLSPTVASAEEPEPFELVRLFGSDFRVSAAKRGLAKLSTERFPTKVTITMQGRLAGPPEAVYWIQPDEGPEYRGTLVTPKKGLDGDAAKAQQDFVARFPKLDPCPPERTAHYDWLPHYLDAPSRNIGWDANVKEVVPGRDGEWIVTVELCPALSSRSFITKICDHVEETYFFKGDVIRLRSSNAKTPNPKFQFYPVMN